MNGVLGQRNGQLIGADNAAGRRKERPDSLRVDVGLHGQQLLAPDGAHAGDTVDSRAPDKAGDLRHILVGKGQHKRAVVFVGDGQLFAELRIHLIAQPVVESLERARLGVMPRMDDAGVGLTGAAGNVGRLFKDGDPDLIAGKAPCGSAADHAAADDRDLNHTFSVLCPIHRNV